MKLYLAATESYPPEFMHECGVSRVLVSYAAGRDALVNRMEAFDDVFVDSGAFTAKQQGRPIQLSDYIAVLDDLAPDTYAALDVIGDAEATRANVDAMRDAGLDPVPVFHCRSDWSYLQQYLDEGCTYIALGDVATGEIRRGELEVWFDACFRLMRDYWPVRVHGFGVTRQWALERYPFYSVDSTTWLVGGKWGNWLTRD